MPEFGQTISHYKIIEKLGGGGMGVTLRAHVIRKDADHMKKKNLLHYAAVIWPICFAWCFDMNFGQTNNSAGVAQQQMIDAKKVANWKGEKVILIADPTGEPFGRDGYGNSAAQTFSNPRKNLPREYGGKAGVIVESTLTEYYAELTVQLDPSGEKIVVREGYLGFFAEKKIAEDLIGRAFWTKGRVRLDESSGRPSVVLNPLSKLEVTRVDWGTPHSTIRLYLKAEDGSEGYLGFGGCVDSRFHTDTRCKKDWDPNADFLIKDPRALYPKWSEDTWELIKSGMVAVGMTEDMVKATCGSDLIKTGAVLSDSGKASPIYKCNYKEFLMEDGKVTKYMNR